MVPEKWSLQSIETWDALPPHCRDPTGCLLGKHLNGRSIGTGILIGPLLVPGITWKAPVDVTEIWHNVGIESKYHGKISWGQVQFWISLDFFGSFFGFHWISSILFLISLHFFGWPFFPALDKTLFVPGTDGHTSQGRPFRVSWVDAPKYTSRDALIELVGYP